MSLSIVIPCLNEVNTIEPALNSAINSAKKNIKNNYEIIVADNGSTDGSLKKLQKYRNIKIVNVPIKGYGISLHYGILSAKYPFVIYADADMSYNFDDIKKFIPQIEKKYDLILGSRIKGHIEKGAMPILNRYIGTPFLTFLINHIYHIQTSDCNSGMRAIRRSFYKRLIMKNSGMEWASELLIKTAISHGKYIEVPINFRKDKRIRKSHLRRWEDGWRHLKVIILLKPSILVILAVIMIILGILFLPISTFTTISMILFGEFWILSYLALHKLRAAIHRESNFINNLLDKIPLVFIASLMTIGGILQLFIISDSHLFTKYILLFQTIIFDLWVFFVETIDTHLINPLPDKL